MSSAGNKFLPPSISVVIPTYRRPELLGRLLKSIAAQTRLPEEVIVVDDASGMDDAYALCIGRYQKRLPKLEYIRLESGGGAPRARNIGLRAAQGSWVALVDDDDEWLPEKLEAQYEIAKSAEPKLGLIYSWANVVRSDGQVVRKNEATVNGNALKAILHNNFITSPTVIVRRSAIFEAGLFDEALPSCQDWDMWIRIFIANYSCACVPKHTATYYQHMQPSVGNSSKALKGHFLFLKRHWSLFLSHTGIKGLSSFVVGVLRIWIR